MEGIPASGKLWRIAMFLMFMFCILASMAQLNDPDPLLWIVVYSIPGGLTFLALLNPQFMDSRWWKLNVAGVLGALFAFSTSYIAAAARKGALHLNPLYSEEGRECSGLVILVVWLALLLCTSYGKLRLNQEEGVIEWVWFLVPEIFLGSRGVLISAGVLVFAVVPLVCWVAYEVYWKVHCQVPPHCSGVF